MTMYDLVERVLRLLDQTTSSRVVIGIAGVPGAGKTNLARDLLEHLSEHLGHECVAHVPMDGYHFENGGAKVGHGSGGIVPLRAE